MKSNGKSPEAYNTDSTKKRAIHRLGGIRVPMINTSPVGSERISAASRGRPGGRNSVVSRYVVPKIIGVSAAR